MKHVPERRAEVADDVSSWKLSDALSHHCSEYSEQKGECAPSDRVVARVVVQAWC